MGGRKELHTGVEERGGDSSHELATSTIQQAARNQKLVFAAAKICKRSDSSKHKHTAQKRTPSLSHLDPTPLSRALPESYFTPLLDRVLTGGKYLVSQVTAN